VEGVFYTVCLFSCRGVCEAWRGFSILMKEHGQWAELAGHDYVMDLVGISHTPHTHIKPIESYHAN
jgi:hypothetical protein